MAVVETLVARQSAVASAPRPSRYHKLAYSIGQTAQSGGFDGALGFVFFYYTAVLGLSGALVGAALAVSLAFDSVVDPVVGAWSDGIRSRLGRRLPPMLLGAPLMGLAMGFLFSPPTRIGELALFAWLTLGTIAVRSFISLFNVPYFALGGEMSADYVERSSIVAWRAVAGILVGVALTAIAFSLFFKGADGLRHASAYPAFGWTVAAVISAASLLCCLGTWRFAAALPSPRPARGALWRRMPAEVAEIFRNGSFRVLFVSSVVFSVAAGLNATLANHAAIFVWKLRSDTLQILTYGYLVGILAGVGLMPALSRRIEKKTAVIIGVIMVAVNWIVLPGLRGLGIIHFTGA
ncbi:MAG: MFS transporter, partial [Caulobacteraceae bacterium]